MTDGGKPDIITLEKAEKTTLKHPLKQNTVTTLKDLWIEYAGRWQNLPIYLVPSKTVQMELLQLAAEHSIATVYLNGSETKVNCEYLRENDVVLSLNTGYIQRHVKAYYGYELSPTTLAKVINTLNGNKSYIDEVIDSVLKNQNVTKRG